MNQDKCNAIEEYLKGQFPGSHIEQTDISANQHYRIRTEKDLLILKMDGDFIDDNSKEEIIDKMKHWHVSKLLKQNSKLGILVTQAGPSKYQLS